MIFTVLFRECGSPDKTAKKAENHSKEGPINTTVGKSGLGSWYFAKDIKN